MRVLFVSQFDLCRGPMARVLALRLATELKCYGATFESAGVDAVPNEPPPPEVVTYLRAHRLNIATHLSRPLSRTLAANFDVLLCMDHAIAKAARESLPPDQAGKVLVFKKAIGFGEGARNKEDILEAETFTQTPLLRVFSELKSATGRLVREIVTLDLEPRDLGVKVEFGSGRGKSVLDDPQVRSFVVRYVKEFVERAFEPPTTEQIAEALQLMGRTLSLWEVEEVLRGDLATLVRKDNRGRWEMDERARADEERAARQRKTQDRTRRMEREAEEEETRQAPPAPPPLEKVTREEAFSILTLAPTTPRATAQKTYRNLLMRYHPDKFHDDEGFRQLAEQKAKRINIAWELVKDEFPEDGGA